MALDLELIKHHMLPMMIVLLIMKDIVAVMTAVMAKSFMLGCRFLLCSVSALVTAA